MSYESGPNSNRLPKLWGDSRRLLQVLINLVKNAIKFTNGGYISIKTLYCEEQESLIVHVEDSGVGISQEEMPRLFKKFGKMKRTATMNNDGIGLGLLIVKQIVKNFNGSVIAMSSGLDHGSVFAFSMQMKSIGQQQ